MKAEAAEYFFKQKPDFPAIKKVDATSAFLLNDQMKSYSRIIVALCALGMIGAYFFPLWFISLDAPQYPEGLSLHLWINKLDGDINTINGLNHYIGMKHMSTEEFPEFGYMKFIVGALIIFGLITAVLNNKKVFLVFTCVFLLLGILGAYDFWKWEYDYGHDLSPTAAIKVPGMSYQPPLLGYKDLLNFTAGSFPDTGGYAIIIPAFLIFLVFIYEWFFNRKKSKLTSLKEIFFLGFIISLVNFSCSTEPHPINYGTDLCSMCRMKIMDTKFGAEVVTKRGRTFKFDSDECLMAYLNTGTLKPEQTAQILVTNFANPGNLIDAKTAFYLQNDKVHSPMNANISSFLNKADAEKVNSENGNSGIIVGWEAIQEFRKTH